jgi:hypothetical protein
MSSVVISGDSSGSVTLTVPSAAGSNTATLPVATGELSMLGGSGQTWQAVTRASGTTYTNSTGKPIMTFMASATGNTTMLIDTLPVSAIGQYGIQAIIPNGSTYRFTGTISSVYELR